MNSQTTFEKERSFMRSQRLTTAQAIILYLQNQYVARDGVETPFFAGCWGIFGHGNVAGIGQALQQYKGSFRYYQSRNEQAMVHTAIAYAKMKNRMQTFACTSSIGPGALNMVTGAAVATVNRIPVLLLPGDIFAERLQGPVLQQLEWEHSPDMSVNDCFKPVSRYWDRINRPEQILKALPEAMRILTSPADTGAVTLSLPQDVQAMAYDFPSALFEKRVWHIPRNRPDAEALRQAAEWIRAAKRPLIVAGGGVHYSEAVDTLRSFVTQTGIPVGETHAGKGALNYDDRLSLGAIGVTGTPGANIIAREADLVIGIGTRYSDFTTASKTAFQHDNVRFININVTEFDAYKHEALPLVGDAKATLQELATLLSGYRTDTHYQARVQGYNEAWDAEVSRIYGLEHGPLISQGEVIGVVNTLSAPQDVVLNAAGSMPGDLHKLWRTRNPKGYHMEYGFSTMGYEIAGGLGAKLAAPEREIYVMVGDASYLMMHTEIVTAVQEGIKLTIILVDNHGYASIGGLSKSVGSDGFGTKYRYRSESGDLDGDVLPVDYAANAASLGAHVIRASNRDELADAITAAKAMTETVCIVVETDRRQRVGGYESWWDVAVAEVSENPDVQQARADYEAAKQKERWWL
jgi:3D-(3,5/4)-trihydroxycyclohexane-1,2-dione acylhydrolase (decyclizing)